MNYFKDKNNKVFAYDDEQVKQGFGKDLTEIEEPILDGKILPNHKNISQVELKEDGSYAAYYNADGTIDTAKESEIETTKLVATYKGYYLDMVNAKLKELDYDSIATVNLWKDDATFGAEATAILTWYKSVIDVNYDILNNIERGTKYIATWADIIPTKEEYLSVLPTYVGI